jgi:hypothetical protein
MMTAMDKVVTVLSFEDFAAQSGVEPLLAEHGALNYPNGISGAERRRNEHRMQARLARQAAGMEQARTEYQRLLAAGAIRPPTEAERLQRTAHSHPGNPAVQAAQRVLARRAARTGHMPQAQEDVSRGLG